MNKHKSRSPDSSKFQESETDQSSSSSDEEEEIKQELADVTFEELQKALSNGSHSFFQKPKEDMKPKRANKNRPVEASCKKPVPTFRDVVQAPKKVECDPRFESFCGKLDPEGFRKRYNFLYGNNLLGEREALQKELKKCIDPKIINDVKECISWIVTGQQLKSDSTKHVDAEILANHKKKEREAARQGKRPFYLKKSEIRKQRLIEKYKELKPSGKLEAFMEKRRKRNAAKDHRYIHIEDPVTMCNELIDSRLFCISRILLGHFVRRFVLHVKLISLFSGYCYMYRGILLNGPLRNYDLLICYQRFNKNVLIYDRLILSNVLPFMVC